MARRQKKNCGSKSKLRAIDLFAGCGGLTVGLKRAGFKVLGAVDIDPLATKTYRYNHRGVRVWETDISRLPVAAVMRELGLRRGSLDLLAGCPPCQGFSSMRTLNGGKRIRDEQNDLLFEFQRFVNVLRPKAIMLENVPRLSKNWRLRSFTDYLARLGYECEKGILDAADFGVPQRRKRFILVALRRGSPRFAESDPKRTTVRDTIKSLPRPGTSNDALHDFPEDRAEHVKAIIRCIPKDGGSRSSLNRQLKCHQDFDGFRDVYGRMSWDSVSPTITGGCVNPSKGRFLHPSQHRAITLREAALLQSFPPKYRFCLDRGKFAVAQMIGNALPSEFIRRHAIELKAALTKKRKSRNGRKQH